VGSLSRGLLRSTQVNRQDYEEQLVELIRDSRGSICGGELGL
jgi:hypothetical protein